MVGRSSQPNQGTWRQGPHRGKKVAGGDKRRAPATPAARMGEKRERRRREREKRREQEQEAETGTTAEERRPQTRQDQ